MEITVKKILVTSGGFHTPETATIRFLPYIYICRKSLFYQITEDFVDKQAVFWAYLNILAGKSSTLYTTWQDGPDV